MLRYMFMIPKVILSFKAFSRICYLSFGDSVLLSHFKMLVEQTATTVVTLGIPHCFCRKFLAKSKLRQEQIAFLLAMLLLHLTNLCLLQAQIICQTSVLC